MALEHIHIQMDFFERYRPLNAVAEPAPNPLRSPTAKFKRQRHAEDRPEIEHYFAFAKALNPNLIDPDSFDVLAFWKLHNEVNED